MCAGVVADGADRGRIGRVEHVEARPAGRDAEHRAQDFGRQARAAHAEQHDVGEAVAFDRAGERSQPSIESAISTGEVSQPRRLAIFC